MYWKPSHIYRIKCILNLERISSDMRINHSWVGRDCWTVILTDPLLHYGNLPAQQHQWGGGGCEVWPLGREDSPGGRVVSGVHNTGRGKLKIASKELTVSTAGTALAERTSCVGCTCPHMAVWVGGGQPGPALPLCKGWHNFNRPNCSLFTVTRYTLNLKPSLQPLLDIWRINFAYLHNVQFQ